MPYYLLFGIDPKLPVDLILPSENEGQQIEQTLHQNWLHKAHERARHKLKAEAILQKQQFDHHGNVKPNQNFLLGFIDKILKRIK